MLDSLTGCQQTRVALPPLEPIQGRGRQLLPLSKIISQALHQSAHRGGLLGLRQQVRTVQVFAGHILDGCFRLPPERGDLCALIYSRQLPGEIQALRRGGNSTVKEDLLLGQQPAGSSLP